MFKWLWELLAICFGVLIWQSGWSLITSTWILGTAMALPILFSLVKAFWPSSAEVVTPDAGQQMMAMDPAMEPFDDPVDDFDLAEETKPAKDEDEDKWDVNDPMDWRNDSKFGPDGKPWL